MLELYHYGPSVCAAKARLALAEKEVEWSDRHLDLMRNEQMDAEFLGLNPHGTVPVLVHEGAVILESTVICEYVDQAFEGPALRPPDPVEQARMRIWTKLVDEEVHWAVRPLTYAVTIRHALLAAGEQAVEAHVMSDPHPQWRERKRRWIHEGLDAAEVTDAIVVFARLVRRMDAELARSEWLAGASWSLADGALTPYADRLETLGLAALWDGQPEFARWLDAVRARPSFTAAVDDPVPAELRRGMRADGERARPKFARMLKKLGI